jgi:hypothetical protein
VWVVIVILYRFVRTPTAEIISLYQSSIYYKVALALNHAVLPLVSVKYWKKWPGGSGKIVVFGWVALARWETFVIKSAHQQIHCKLEEYSSHGLEI